MITVKEMIDHLINSDAIRIKRDKEVIYTGYKAMLLHDGYESIGLTGEESMQRFSLETDIKHKKWQQLGLMPPIEPDKLPDYEFSDLQLNIYNTIYI